MARRTKEQDISGQVDALKRDLAQLTELVQTYGEKKGEDIAHSFAERARDFVERARTASSSLADELSGLAEDPRRAVERGREFARDEVHQLEDAVSERPLVALGWALAAGFLVGWICGRR